MKLLRDDRDVWWNERINALFELRPHKNVVVHRLSAEAVELFVNFCNECGRRPRGLAEDLQRFATRRPEQVLKIALLFNLVGGDAHEIERHLVEAAIELITRLATDGMRSAVALFGKLRLHGRQRKRELFRRYNCQAYSRLEPTLARALESRQIRYDGEYLLPVA